MKRVFWIAVALTTIVMGCATAEKENDNYVLMISLDGFRHDLASMANTPTLDSLRAVGVYADIAPCFPANTFPNHYSMATGLHPDHHGLINNTFYDTKLGLPYAISNGEARKNADFYGGEPIWSTATQQGKPAHVYFWVGVEAKVGGVEPEVWYEYDGDVPYKQRADWVIEALHRPEAEIPRLVMAYFEEPDAVEHSYSPTSPQTVAKVEELDAVLGYLFSSLRTSPVFDRLNIIVTSDHGMTETSPERYFNLYPLLDADRIEMAVDGVPLYLAPEEDYVDEAYEIIAAQPHLQVFRREAMPEEYHYGTTTDRITPLIVLPEMGWRVGYTERDYPPTPKSGTHGYDPFGRDMQMIFYGAGPAFKKGYTHDRVFQNLNDYLIVCHILGLEPAPNDCSWEDIEGLFAE